MGREHILILDFGSQYTQLIARRVREWKVYAEIVRFDYPLDEIRRHQPKGLILSGGPESIYLKDAPRCDPAIFDLNQPILGICYGLHLMAALLRGGVKRAENREFGRTGHHTVRPTPLLREIQAETTVWMSHGDFVSEMPPGFEQYGETGNAPLATIGDPDRKFYGLQYHPEVQHTEEGATIFRNFLLDICGCEGTWDIGSFAEETILDLRERIGKARVICGVSGGIDSLVTAVLLHRAVDDQLTCIHIDNGLLRENETQEVETILSRLNGLDFVSRDASERFLEELCGVSHPEQKRKIIGAEFIRVFEEEAQRVEGARFLAQGTLYPDVIESTSVHGPSALIKTHHNVGGLPEDMGFQLIEPLRYLFKDEVREVAKLLGIDEAFTWRHPFPGPGLAVRIIGEVTPERLSLLRRSDAIFLEALREAGLYQHIAQAFAVLLPIQSVGVMGDDRSYENVIALRAVETNDFMTADWARLPHELLARISTAIVNQVPGVNRVVYDISTKPPSTIEWE